MLEAERAALATEAYHNSLSILEREMGVLLQYLTNIGTQAALLGGFVFGSLATEVVKAGEDGQVAAWFEGLFLGAFAFSFGMMMYTVLISTLSASLGPTMALKGKDGSAMRLAIQHMRRDKQLVMRAFFAGTFAFLAVIIMQVWLIVHDDDLAQFIAVALVLVACILFTLWSIRKIFRQYTVEQSSGSPGQGVVTGAEFLNKAARTTATSAAQSITTTKA